jgi:hypothetical protein
MNVLEPAALIFIKLRNDNVFFKIQAADRLSYNELNDLCSGTFPRVLNYKIYYCGRPP